MTPAGRGLALAGAAALVFGGAFAVGNSSGGEDEKEIAPSGAKEVAVPDAEASAPTLASVGKLPQLRPPPPSATGSGTGTGTTTTAVTPESSGGTTGTTTPSSTSTTTTTTGTTGSSTTTGTTGSTTGGSTTGSSTTTTTGG